MATPPNPSSSAPLEWHPLEEFEGAYEVSRAGEVRSTGRSKRILLGSAYAAGPVKVTMVQPGTGKPVQRSVARLVAAAFLPPSNLPLLKHKDDDKYNCAASNLEYADYVRTNPKTIMKHAMSKGLMKPTNHYGELQKINAARRLEAETARICNAIKSVQPLTLLTVFGDAVFRFPENILPAAKLDETYTLAALRAKMNLGPHHAEPRLRTPQPSLPHTLSALTQAQRDAIVDKWFDTPIAAVPLEYRPLMTPEAVHDAEFRRAGVYPSTAPTTPAPTPTPPPVIDGGPGPIPFDITAHVQWDAPPRPDEVAAYWRRMNDEEVVIPPEALAAPGPTSTTPPQRPLPLLDALNEDARSVS